MAAAQLGARLPAGLLQERHGAQPGQRRRVHRLWPRRGHQLSEMGAVEDRFRQRRASSPARADQRAHAVSERPALRRVAGRGLRGLELPGRHEGLPQARRLLGDALAERHGQRAGHAAGGLGGERGGNAARRLLSHRDGLDRGAAGGRPRGARDLRLGVRARWLGDGQAVEPRELRSSGRRPRSSAADTPLPSSATVPMASSCRIPGDPAGAIRALPSCPTRSGWRTPTMPGCWPWARRCGMRPSRSPPPRCRRWRAPAAPERTRGRPRSGPTSRRAGTRTPWRGMRSSSARAGAPCGTWSKPPTRSIPCARWWPTGSRKPSRAASSMWPSMPTAASTPGTRLSPACATWAHGSRPTASTRSSSSGRPDFSRRRRT